MIYFICGRSGKGKTTYIFDLIEKNTSLNKKYLIVPDQMSLQTQLALVNHVSNNILSNVEVMGFKIFIQRLSELLNLQKIKYLDDFSKKLLLQHTLLSKKNIINKKNELENIEFIENLYKFLSENYLNNNNLTSEVISSLKNEHLKNKILNIIDILKHFSDLDDELKDIISDCYWYKKIFLYLKDEKAKKIFSKIDIYIDSYTTFSFMQKEIFSQILKIVDNGAITFNFDIANPKHDKDIFYTAWKDYSFFIDIIPKSQIINLKDNKTQNRFSKNFVLDYLERNFDKRFDNHFKPENINGDETITLNCYENIEEEVSNVCLDIRKKIIESNIKSSNFAIYIPDKRYRSLVDKYFSLYDIPYYIDIKVPFLEFSFFKWLFIMNEFYCEDWTIDNFISLISNDFFLYKIKLEQFELNLFIDYISNYLNDINKEILGSDKYWIYYDNPSKINISIDDHKTLLLNKVRRYIYSYIISFEKIYKNTYPSNKDFLLELYNFFIKLNLKEYVHNFSAFKTSLLFKIQDLKENIWSSIVNFFDQLIYLIGEHNYIDSYMNKYIKLTLEENYFINYPSSFDGVMIGDYYRTRFQNIFQEDETMGIKHLYLLGMSSDLYPYINNDKKLFTDEEIMELNKNNILDISTKDPENDISFSILTFYILSTSTKETLNISYYLYSDTSKESHNVASPILNIFSKIGININKDTTKKQQLYYNYYNLDVAKIELINNFKHHMLQNTYLYQIIKYIQPQFINNILDYSNNYEINDYNLLDIKEEEYSVTQIEDYNSCPYKFFLKYILGFEIKNKPINLKTYQVGNIIHDIFEFIGKYSLKHNKKPSDIRDFEEIIKKYIENYKEKYLNKHPLNINIENNYIINRIINDAKTILIKEFIKIDNNSNFIPFNIEKKFKIKLKNDILVSCKVDRIDVDKTNKFYRLLDYKTYDKKISFNDIYTGTQLQLLLYSYIIGRQIKKKWSGSSYFCFNNRYENVSKNNKENLFFKNNGFYYKSIDNLINYDNHILKNKYSSITKCKINNTGKISITSQVIDENQLRDIDKFIYDKTLKTTKNIKERKFKAYPIIKNKDIKTLACKYCSYNKVCRYAYEKKLYNNKTVEIDSNRNFSSKINSFLTKIKKREDL